MTITEIARVCHEANRAICQAAADHTQVSWEAAAPWQRESAIRGVEFLIDNPEATETAQHEAWSKDKLADGWKHGPVKDAATKTHPCLVPYHDLPFEQRVKDYVFQAVARTLLVDAP